MSRTTTILLLVDDYADRLNALYSAAQDAERKAATKPGASLRMGDATVVESQYEELRGAYEALRVEAEAAATRVVLKALGRRDWRVLKDKHPPRTTGDESVVKGDRLAGVNTDTVEDDLVYAALVEPAFGSRDGYQEWADDLSEGEFQTVLSRAWSLVNTAATDPKSLPVSQTPRSG